MVLEQAQGVARLDVLREDEHADLRMLGADRLGGRQPLVGVRRRHSDVDDRRVRPFYTDVPQKPRGVLRLADDLDAGVGQQADDALARQHQVVGDDYAHGINARRPVGWISSSPPSAPMRSRRCTSSACRAVPSSRTATTTWPSSRTTSTAACGAPRASASSSASTTVTYAAASTGASK